MGNMGLILEGLHEARFESDSGLPCYKSKTTSNDQFLTDFTSTIEDRLEKSLKSELGWVRCNGSSGMKFADKSIDNIEIRVKFDPSKDANMALDLVSKEMEKFIRATGEKPRLSARAGEIIIAQNNIIAILRALESVYGIKLENYFTKASLKKMKG